MTIQQNIDRIQTTHIGSLPRPHAVLDMMKAKFAGQPYDQKVYDATITKAVADLALNLLDVDEHGFDHQDRRLLLTMIEKFDGGPVGVDSLAAAISEERHTIEDVLEPYLIQQGYIMRTPRGRVVTRHAYLHFGLNIPSRLGEMPVVDEFLDAVDD